LSQVCQTLIDWYLYIFKERSVQLLELSRYVVADAYFSKKSFVDGMISMGFHLVSRVRDDAALMYITEKQSSGKRGRPRKYDGKIHLEKPDESRFKIFSLEPGQGSLLYAIVYSKALARNIGLCIWKSEDGKTRKLFFSTDTQMQARDIWEYYRCRFQIEFCYRDAKQFTGLCHAQSRDLKKLNFHFNASMTAVNIAKSIALNRGQSLSMASTKVLLHNSFLLERFITVSGISPNHILNQRLWEEVVCFAARAA
jgi:hypothetical protein